MIGIRRWILRKSREFMSGCLERERNKRHCCRRRGQRKPVPLRKSRFRLHRAQGKNNSQRRLGPSCLYSFEQETVMSLAQQLLPLAILALPVSSIAWTITHEEIF